MIVRIKLVRFVLLVLVGLLTVSCATQDGLQNPLSQITNADLSPSWGMSGKDGALPPERNAPASPQYEFYPGKNAEERRRFLKEGVVKVEDGYEVEFNNAPIAQVAQAILGKILKETYTLNALVRGKVTLSTGRPVSREELLTIFEATLQMKGGALVRTASGYKIDIAGAERNRTAKLVEFARPGKRTKAGYGISVLPMRYVSAATLKPLMDRFIASSNSLRAIVAFNILFIRGNAEERQSLANVAATFDVDWLEGQSVGIFPLINATPSEIIPELNELFRTAEKDLGDGVIKLLPVDRMNSIIVVTPRSEYLEKTANWIQRLDRKSETRSNLYVYRVENAKAKDLANLLNSAFGDTNLSQQSEAEDIAPGATVKRVASIGTTTPAQTQDEEITGTPAQPQTPTVTESKKEPDVKPSGKIRITADKANNMLLIHSSGRIYKKILAVLRRLDRPPAQVLIHTTIAEVTLNDKLRHGVQFYLKDSGGALFNAAKLPLAPTFPGLNFVLGGLGDPSAVIDALSDITKVRVVSSPSVVATANQPAVLQVGDEVPITTKTTNKTGTEADTTVSEVEFRNTGVILKVTPRISTYGTVSMNIEQEVSQVSDASEEGTLTPTISTRRVASRVSVDSGQTVVMGGLISEKSSKARSGIPKAIELPFIGGLFGATNNKAIRSELIIFIRPQVIRSSWDAANVAKELRSRMRSMSTYRDTVEQSWKTLVKER